MEKPLETSHRIIIGDARQMEDVGNESIDLVVTSPPYPMIQMWDDLFSAADPAVAHALKQSDTRLAFGRMHRLLDEVWDEIIRVLTPGGIVCINIGDATRSFGGHFQLFANHAAIISSLSAKGLSQLPTIIWHKTTNAPNKFMGSGMLPPGAYVTLEHEYILIFRKGGNTWFSDVWMGLQGVVQGMDNGGSRQRSAAFPLELPYRLICMFSLKGQKVLDPFLGTGTTMLAAMCTARESVGYESDNGLQPAILERVTSTPQLANQIIHERLEAHTRFVIERTRTKGDLKYRNRFYGFPVMTRQEEDLYLDPLRHVQYQSGDHVKITYGRDQGLENQRETVDPIRMSEAMPQRTAKGRQLKLF